MKTLETSLIILCFIGNAIHLGCLIYKYTLYEVGSTVSIETPEEITLPAVSFRTELHTLFLWKKMTDDQKRRLVTCNDTIGLYHVGNPCGDKEGKFVFPELNNGNYLNSTILSKMVAKTAGNFEYQNDTLIWRKRYIDRNLLAQFDND